MSTMPTAADVPTQTDLREMAGEFVSIANAVAGAIDELFPNPDGWARLAALMQYFGDRLSGGAAELADGLAAYSEANPELAEAPEHGPGLMLLGDLHNAIWQEAINAVAAVDLDAPHADRVAAYTAAAQARFGRPELQISATELEPGIRRGPMMLAQTLRIDDRDVLMRVYFGGIDNDPARIERELMSRGIDAAVLEYWPPVDPAALIPLPSGPCDAYGRRIHLPEAPPYER
jgi:hypothetical protein